MFSWRLRRKRTLGSGKFSWKNGRGGPSNDRNGSNIAKAWSYHYNLFTPQLLRNSWTALVLHLNRSTYYNVLHFQNYINLFLWNSKVTLVKVSYVCIKNTRNSLWNIFHFMIKTFTKSNTARLYLINVVKRLKILRKPWSLRRNFIHWSYRKRAALAMKLKTYTKKKTF